MTIRKTKSGKWTVDVSNGFHPVTQKRIRIIRKGLKSKKEALELEQHIRVVELKEKQKRLNEVNRLLNMNEKTNEILDDDVEEVEQNRQMYKNSYER